MKIEHIHWTEVGEDKEAGWTQYETEDWEKLPDFFAKRPTILPFGDRVQMIYADRENNRIYAYSSLAKSGHLWTHRDRKAYNKQFRAIRRFMEM